jgi:hypothetical protein
MGSIASPVKTIDHINFQPLPKHRKVSGVIYTDGSSFIMLGEHGALYTNLLVQRKVHCCGRWAWSDFTNEALFALKKISKEEYDQHQTYLDHIKDHEGAEKILRVYKDLVESGLRHTPSQKKQALKAWDSLPEWRQKQMDRYHYRPAGAVIKPEEKSDE